MTTFDAVNDKDFVKTTFPFQVIQSVACIFQDCARLRQEKGDLEARVEAQTEQIAMLRTHISLIRQHTVTFILNQMDTLHMQRDTEV